MSEESLLELGVRYIATVKLPWKSKLLAWLMLPCPGEPAGYDLGQLADLLGFTQRTTAKWLQVLIDRGLVRRDGDLYALTFPPMETMAKRVWEFFKEYHEAS